MPLDDSIWLPTEEELQHREIPLTHNFFISSAMWLGKYCDDHCKEFMLCRTEEKDPRKCLEYGQKVTECGFEFFKKVKNTCKDELEWYTACLDYSGSPQRLEKCREEQAIFDGCMYENGFERAKFGHFQMLRVHESDRPKPKRFVPIFPNPASTSVDVFAPENREPGPHGLAGHSPAGSWTGP